VNEVNWQEFSAALAMLGLTPQESHRERFALYCALLQEYNERVNLTAIVDEGEIWRKHFLDSLSSLLVLPRRGSGIDIGSGAGFPGLPLAIVCEDLQFTLLDSLRKRVGFLQEVIDKLSLGERVVALHGRAEDLAHLESMRGKFDFAVSRAVAKFAVLCELSLPFVKTGGLFIAMKGPRAHEEIEEAGNAVRRLGGGKAWIVPWQLPGSMEERVLVVVPKEFPTEKRYPRRAGTPEKNPLR